MFKWRKDRSPKAGSKQPILCLLDSDMQVLFRGRLNNFPLPESVVLACSEEFFNDPTPCEIHRRAVQLRLYVEMQQALPENVTVPFEDVPPCISLYCQEMHPAFIRLEISHMQ